MKNVNEVAIEKPVNVVMSRCGRIRKFLEDYNQSSRANKLSFFLPYLILVFELIVLIDALIISNLIIIIITLILVTISCAEIILLTKEFITKKRKNVFSKKEPSSQILD